MHHNILVANSFGLGHFLSDCKCQQISYYIPNLSWNFFLSPGLTQDAQTHREMASFMLCMLPDMTLRKPVLHGFLYVELLMSSSPSLHHSQLQIIMQCHMKAGAD